MTAIINFISKNGVTIGIGIGSAVLGWFVGKKQPIINQKAKSGWSKFTSMFKRTKKNQDPE
jgi:hypothetical protein